MDNTQNAEPEDDSCIEVPISESISFNPAADIERPSVRYLVQQVVRAADELEHQGPRSQRICLQLLTALARYESAAADELGAQAAIDACALRVAVTKLAQDAGSGARYMADELLEMVKQHGLRLELAK